MTKEEIALQLTLARLDKLTYTELKSTQDKDHNKLYNEAITEETYKMFNTIYENLNLEDK